MPLVFASVSSYGSSSLVNDVLEEFVDFVACPFMITHAFFHAHHDGFVQIAFDFEKAADIVFLQGFHWHQTCPLVVNEAAMLEEVVVTFVKQASIVITSLSIKGAACHYDDFFNAVNKGRS